MKRNQKILELLNAELDGDVQVHKANLQGKTYEEIQEYFEKIKIQEENRAKNSPRFDLAKLLNRWLTNSDNYDEALKLCAKDQALYKALIEYTKIRLRNNEIVDSNISDLILRMELGLQEKPKRHSGAKQKTERNRQVIRLITIIKKTTQLKLGTNAQPANEDETIINMVSDLFGLGNDTIKDIWKNKEKI